MRKEQWLTLVVIVVAIWVIAVGVANLMTPTELSSPTVQQEKKLDTPKAPPTIEMVGGEPKAQPDAVELQLNKLGFSKKKTQPVQFQ